MVNIMPFNVARPNYNFAALGEAAESVAERMDLVKRREREKRIGAATRDGGLSAGSNEAFASGDLRTGAALRAQSQQEEQALFARNQVVQRAAADRAAWSAKMQAAGTPDPAKAQRYVANMLTTLDPGDPKFAGDWGFHLKRLRSAGHEIPAEYDDPRLGYQMALSEVTDMKQRLSMRSDAAKALPANAAEIPDFVRDARTDEDGNVYFVSGPEQADRTRWPLPTAPAETDGQPAERGDAPANPEEAKRPLDFGFRPSQVPGVVVGRGRSDRFATDRNDQLESVKSASAPLISDAVRFRRVQQYYRWRNDGREPSVGHYYRADGTIGSLKDESPTLGRETLNKTARLVTQYKVKLDALGETYLGTNLVTRAISSGLKTNTLGRAAMSQGVGNEESAQAKEEIKQAVLQIVYDLSGKQVTNQEMIRFLTSYAPQSGDGEKIVRHKIGIIKDMMTALATAKTNGASADEIHRLAMGGWKEVDETRKDSKRRLRGEPEQRRLDDANDTLRSMTDRIEERRRRRDGQ